MRFAWLHKQAAEQGQPAPKESFSLIRMAYNAVFWVFVLPFINVLDFRTGFIAFALVIAIRLSANSYRTNRLTPAQDRAFPFRA